MSANSLQTLANAGKGESTRTLLRVIILFLIAGASISSRLFSVIRKSQATWATTSLHNAVGLTMQSYQNYLLPSGSANHYLLFLQVSRVLSMSVRHFLALRRGTTHLMMPSY